MTNQKKGFRASQSIISQQLEHCLQGELDQITSVLSTSRHTMNKYEYRKIKKKLLDHFNHRPDICAFIHNQEAYTLYKQKDYAGALREFKAVITDLNRRIAEDINGLSLFTSRMAIVYVMAAKCIIETNTAQDICKYKEALKAVNTSMSYRKSSDSLFLKTNLHAMVYGDQQCTMEDETDWHDLVTEKYPWISRELQLRFYQVLYETYMVHQQLEAAYQYVVKGCLLDSEYFYEKMEHFRKDLRGRLFYQEKIQVLYA